MLYYVSVVLCIIFANSIIYAFTGNGPFAANIYNSYSLQANAWLSGRLDLGRNYSHLEIALYNGKYFISFPPFPSVVLLPFALFFGTATPDALIVLFMAAVSGVYAFKLADIFLDNFNASFFLSLFVCVGSNFLFLSNSGAVWFMAQAFAFAFTLMSLYYACKKSGKGCKPALSLFFLCCAMGCRPFQAVYLPVVLYLIYINKKLPLIQFIKKIMLWAAPALILGVFYMLLNYARFGRIFEFGHNYLPEFQEAAHGQFSTHYLAENIKNLLRLPKLSGGKITFEKFNGTAFWLVSPAFLSYAVLFVKRVFERKKMTLAERVIFFAVPFFILLHFLLLCLHRTMGGWHFGNRYTVDALPVLLLGIVSLKPDRKLFQLLNLPLLLFGAGINIAGTILLYNNIL